MTFNYRYNKFGNINNILYVGDDSNYWAQVKKEYDKHFSHISCLFYLYRVQGQVTYRDIFLKTLQLKPSVIYLDFTKNHHDMFHLSRLISRDGHFDGSSVVGFVNHIEEVDEVLKNGCQFVFVKCGELFDVVFGPLRYCLPDKVTSPNFAKGILDEKREIYIPLRVGCIHPKKILFEGNFSPTDNQEYEIETLIDRSIMPSKVFENVVFPINPSNYYNHNRAFYMDCTYVKKPNLIVEVEKAKRLNQKIDASPQMINASVAEYKSERQAVRKNFLKWVNSKLKSGKEKLTRILIIDDRYEVIDPSNGDLSDSPYAYRMQSLIEFAQKDLKFFRPDLIVFNLMNEPSLEEARKIIFEHKKKIGSTGKYQASKSYSEEKPISTDKIDLLDIEIKDNEDESELKDELVGKIIDDQLTRFFDYIKSNDGYEPSVLIFNCRQSSEKIKEEYEFQKLISTQGSFDFELVSKLAKVLENNKEKQKLNKMEKKLQSLKQNNPQKYKNVKARDLVESNYFVHKSEKLSSARLKLEVTVLAISESEIWFTSSEEIDFGVYEMDMPTKIRFSLAPNPETFEEATHDKENVIYHGLIHSFDENGKKLLRQDVNRIFFSDLIAQRELESKEYQEMTKDALGKKMEELERLKRIMELNEIKKK